MSELSKRALAIDEQIRNAVKRGNYAGGEDFIVEQATLATELARECERLQGELDKSLQPDNIKYLIGRLEEIKDYVDDGNRHMAAAKLLADISALRGLVDGE